MVAPVSASILIISNAMTDGPAVFNFKVIFFNM